MNRFIEYTVFSGLVTAWRRAMAPTSRSPFFANATTDGVVRAPSAAGITTGLPPSMTATHEFVVPKSIPIILFILSAFPIVQLESAYYGKEKYRNMHAMTAYAGLQAENLISPHLIPWNVKN
jgi:hypothetical protein